MLVLSRKENERICLSGGIEIVVVAIRGDNVRLGICAPNNVRIHREELAAKIAAGLAPPEPPAKPAPVEANHASPLPSLHSEVSP